MTDYLWIVYIYYNSLKQDKIMPWINALDLKERFDTNDINSQVPRKPTLSIVNKSMVGITPAYNSQFVFCIKRILRTNHSDCLYLEIWLNIKLNTRSLSENARLENFSTTYAINFKLKHYMLWWIFKTFYSRTSS